MVLLSGSQEKRLALIEDRFMRHMELEEEAMRIMRDNNESLNRKLDKMTEAIVHMDAKIDRNHLNTDLKLSNSAKELRTHMEKHYARRDELTSAMNSLRNSAKIIWIAILCFASVTAWMIDKMMVLIH